MLALRAGVWTVIWKQSGVMKLELEVTAAKLTGDSARDIKSLSNHVFMLEEKLRYTLRNLDVTNFNDLGLARYENGRLQIYTKEVEVQTEKLRVEFGKETDEIHALISATADELLAEIEDVEGNYTTLKATVNGIQSTVKSHTASINDQAVTNKTLQSQIKQTSDKISAVVSAVDDNSGNVTAASIVAAINGAASTVKISADHITLAGVVTVQDLAGNGTVQINAGNIAAGGTISGVGLESTGNYYWQQVRIADGQIYLYSGALYDNSYGEIMLYSSSTLHLQSWDGYVRIYPGTTAYWEFRSSGIFWCDQYGNVMNSVALNGG